MAVLFSLPVIDQDWAHGLDLANEMRGEDFWKMFSPSQKTGVRENSHILLQANFVSGNNVLRQWGDDQSLTNTLRTPEERKNLGGQANK